MRLGVLALGIAIALVADRPPDGLLWLLVLIPVNMVVARLDPRRAHAT